MLNIKKIAVGISGGVDSAVTALLLKKKGYDVEGVFMQNWDIIDERGVCSVDSDYKYAQYVCEKLDIKLHHVNFVKTYWNEVFCNLIKEYKNGLTPNPDVLCNRFVKFNQFYKYTIVKLGAHAIATGHYARTSFGPYLEHYQENEDVRLYKGRDNIKDQTFFLCQVEQEALRKTMFPLGEYLKPEVKQIAFENGLEKIAKKKESMGICFIGSRNFQEFIGDYIEEQPGKFIDIDTAKEVGEHKGIHQWTLGQRSRLKGLPNPYFIAKKDKCKNKIYVAMGTKHPALQSNLFFTSKPHWIHKKPKELVEKFTFLCQFKFQHTHDLVDCEIGETEIGLVIRLFKSIRALTEGQYAVFYNENECLGSARITNSGPTNFIYYWLENNQLCKISNLLESYNKKKLK